MVVPTTLSFAAMLRMGGLPRKSGKAAGVSGGGKGKKDILSSRERKALPQIIQSRLSTPTNLHYSGNIINGSS